jgi:branched-chain amino acid aminotransferase
MPHGEDESQQQPHKLTNQHADPDPSLDWDSFTFSLNNVATDVMWLDTVPNNPYDGDNEKSYSSCINDCLVPLGPIQLHPASTILNYGQGLFEGMKAFRRPDGNIVLFRPDKNGQRMHDGAKRFCLPPVPVPVFVTAADAIVRGNARWVPPSGKGALYLRPLLFGSGDALGVAPSPEATFAIYCSPVGNYFAATANGAANWKAIRLLAVRGYCRAAPGGSGGVKAAGNYAPGTCKKIQPWITIWEARNPSSHRSHSFGRLLFLFVN